jgi:hypothetical protein
MDSADMSKRAHWMLRLAALAVIAAAAWLPRGGAVSSSVSSRAASLGASDGQAIHASVAAR